MGAATEMEAVRSEAAGLGRRWLPVVFATALLLLGAGAGVTASSLPEARARVVGAPVPIDPGAADPADIRAHNSPTLAQNPASPANLVVANRVDSPRFSCALHVSTDSGATWVSSSIPFPEGEELPPRCFAPDVAFGPNGTLYLSFVTLKGPGNVPNAVWTASSSDGGLTLSVPRPVAGPDPLAFQVRLAADQRRSGLLYLAWLQASETANLSLPVPGNPILVARSDDGGLSWRRPARVSPPSRARVVAPSLAVGRHGVLFLSYLDLGDDVLDYAGAHEGRGGEPDEGPWALVLARSGDEGRTWRETVVDEALVPTERFVVFLPPTPSLALDGENGRVYLGFHDGRLGDPDVWVWSSPDGRRFGRPVRVNDTRPGDGRAQYLPKLAVAPGGRLDVVYYDRRADPANMRNEVSFQSSSGGGRAFTPRLRLSDRPFDARIGFGRERGLPDLGNRLGLVSTRGRAMAVWADTRAGTEVSKKQDLARAVVAFTPASSWATPLRGAATLLGVVGLGLLVVGTWPLGRRRRREQAEARATTVPSPPPAG